MTSDRKTNVDWARFTNEIASQYESAKKITLIMDNLNTHEAGSFYEVFAPDTAKALWERFEFVPTPKHGSWLNVAEIELSVLTRHSLDRRIADIETVEKEVAAWQKFIKYKIARLIGNSQLTMSGSNYAAFIRPLKVDFTVVLQGILPGSA